MVIFTFFVMAMMLLVGGMAVDMMRFENYRSRLQAAVDRSVLAAADLDVCLDPATDPAAVVEDFLAKAGFEDQVEDVVVTSGLSSCTVAVTAQIDVNTIFMQMVGIDQLTTPMAAVATEAATGIEISLVLDTSGSMGREGRIQALRPAAQAFVQTIMDSYPPGDVSISTIPYSSNVNIGPDLAAAFNLNGAHDYSYCIDPEDGPNFFDNTAVNLAATYFNEKLEDEINGFVFDPDSGLATAANQDGTSERKGVEVIADASVGSSWRFLFNYTYLDATEPGPDEQAPEPPSTLTATGAVMGTPAYMAPEQHTSRTSDPRVDQFAFCVTLWEGLTGARPGLGERQQRGVHDTGSGEDRDRPRGGRRRVR